MRMNYIYAFAAIAAAVAVAPAAQAAHVITYTAGSPTESFTATFKNDNPTTGFFSDVFTPFTTTLGGFLSGTIGTTGVQSHNDLDFTLARVTLTSSTDAVGTAPGNDTDFFPLVITAGSAGKNFNPDATEQGSFSGIAIGPGTYNLRVQGNAGHAAVYSGTLAFTANQMQAAVPEPSTWAMMLFGFGAIGFGMRRRRKDNVRVRFAV